jgi:hypothetical protein
MPNWCTNTTNVFGKKDKVRLFEAAIAERAENEGFISTLFPCPQELRDSTASFVDMENPIPENWKNLVSDGTWTQEQYDERVAETLADVEKKKALIEKYGFKDWYDWSLHNWGTKWGDCDLRIDDVYINNDDTSTLELRYETAWGPALEALTHISTLFPKLIFYTFYREEGIGFAGYHKVCNGDVIVDQSAELIFDADDYEYIIDGEDEQELDGMIN